MKKFNSILAGVGVFVIAPEFAVKFAAIIVLVVAAHKLFDACEHLGYRIFRATERSS